MINVDIVTAEMRGVNGANRVTEKLILGENIFQNNGINLRYLYTDAGKKECATYESTLGEYSKTYVTKRSVIDRLKKLSIYKTKFIQEILQRRVINFSKKSVNQYFKNCEPADCIIFQDVFSAYYFLKKRQKKSTKTIFITHTDTDPLEHYLINRPQIKGSKTEKYIRNIYKFVFENVNSVVTICPQAFFYIKNHYNANAVCIINGIEDLNYEEISKRTFTTPLNVVELGTVTYRKGQDLLIKGFNRLSIEKKDKIHIHIIGKGDMLADIENYVKNNDLEKYVTLYGEVKDVSNLLNKMNFMILPSRADTVPISIIEGLRVGLPVFATNNGEVSNMVINCGNLIETSEEGVKKAFEQMISFENEYETVSKNARKKYEDFYSLEKMINSYCECVHSIFKEEKTCI